METTLIAEKRTVSGKGLTSLRANGKIPAVMYGPKEEAQAITLDTIAFTKIYKEAGESTVLSVEGLGDIKDVLVQDVAYDSVRGDILHVDLYAIERGKKLIVSVPLEFVGEAPGVKKGGVLTKVLHEIEVESLPRNLPHEIVVDVSVLAEIEDQIHVRDLVMPEGVVVQDDGDDVVVVVNAVEEEVETPVTVDMNAIEVEKKGKVEKDETAG